MLGLKLNIAFSREGPTVKYPVEVMLERRDRTDMTLLTRHLIYSLKYILGLRV